MKFYVSTTGNDFNPGSLAQPFLTIAYAQSVVQGLVAAGLTEAITVYLRGGTYTQTSGLTFGAADSGTAACPIAWAAYPGEIPIVSGLQTVTGWSLFSGSIYRAAITPGWTFRQLYVNGTHAQRARGALNPAGWTRTGTGYTAPDSSMASWGNKTNIEIVSLGTWSMDRIKVASITGSAVTMKAAGWAIQNSILFGYCIRSTPSWIENAYELMASGYWYLDATANYLYYWPPSGSMTGVTVQAPFVGSPLVNIASASYLTFSIAFDGSNWTGPDANTGYVGIQSGDFWNGPNSPWSPSLASVQPGAVAVTASNNITLAHSSFKHMGSRAVYISGGCSHVTVQNNRFADNAAGAIQIGNGAAYPTQESHISVRGNLPWSGGAFDYIDNEAIYSACMDSSVIANNLCTDRPGDGITIGWYGDAAAYTTNNVIQANCVLNTCTGFTDAGGIYVRGSQSAAGDYASGLQLIDNYINNTNIGVGLVYIDQLSRWVTISRNTLQNGGTWYFGPNAEVADIQATGNFVSPASYSNGGTRITLTPNKVITTGTQAVGTAAQSTVVGAGIPYGVIPGLQPSTDPLYFVKGNPPIPVKQIPSFRSVPSNGLVGYYPLTEGSGNVAYNYYGVGSLGGAWHGNNVSSGTHYQIGRFSVPAGAFDGTTNWIDMGNNASPLLSATGDWTVSGWVVVSGNQANPYIFSQYPGVFNRGTLLMLDGTGPFTLRMRLRSYDGAGNQDIYSTATFTAGGWHYFAFMRAGKKFSVVLDNNAPVNYSDPDGARSLPQVGNIIGGTAASLPDYSPATLLFTGSLSDIRVYNRALTIAELRMSYNSGR